MPPSASLAGLGYFPVPALGAIGIVVAKIVTGEQGVSRDSGDETGKAHVPAGKGLVAEDARVRFLTGICRRLVASFGEMRSGVRTA
jgi:hypothetical protein